jgi:hypothetical protein
MLIELKDTSGDKTQYQFTVILIGEPKVTETEATINNATWIPSYEEYA